MQQELLCVFNKKVVPKGSYRTYDDRADTKCGKVRRCLDILLPQDQFTTSMLRSQFSRRSRVDLW